MQKDDVIYKQDALDAIDKRIQFLKDDPVFRRKHGDIDLYGIKPIIRALPPAQLERKMGKWIQNDNGTYSCSLCHSWIPEEQHYYAQYCLYCGADMRGKNNETDNSNQMG